MKVRLDKFNNAWYKSGSLPGRLLWYFTNWLFFDTGLPVPSSFKCTLLRLFGAKVGSGVVIKPSVNIKYPWFLEIGDHTWIGENAWIDNLARVRIGNHACISQGAYLLTGNHDYKKEAFDLVIGEIMLEDGVWVGAKAVVCPGVTCRSHSILAVGSVTSRDLEPYGIYRGNPAVLVKTREIAG